MASNPSVTNQDISVESIFGLAMPTAPTIKPYADVPDELKRLNHWACFRHETNHGKTGNVPYRVDGRAHASPKDSLDWSPFDDAVAAAINHTRNFDGVSFMLLGTPYLGLDFDDVVQDGRLDPYVASILRVMGEPYAEVSFSGAGLRVFVNCPNLPRPAGKSRFDSKSSVEIYHGEWAAKALTVTGNHYSGQFVTTISAAQFELVYALCSQIQDAKFKALWLGDTSEYGMDDSRADEALCCKLARLFNFNPEKMDGAFRWSALGRRDKWKRKDYRDITIAAAIKFEKARDSNKPAKSQLVFRLPAVATTEANASDYVVARLPEQPDRDDGWFPRGAVSLVGAPSGASKTTLMYQMLLTQACKGIFLGHATHGLSFCVMGLDRGDFAHLRTTKRMALPPDTIPFGALSLAWDFDIVQQIVTKLEARAVVPDVLLLEGVDMMVSEVSDIKSVTIFMNLLNQVAKHYHIAIIGTLGSPKIKVGQGYAAKRDNLLGSSAWGRECEAILNLQFPQSDDTDGRRLLFVLLRNGPAEKFTLGFENGQLIQIPDIAESEMDSASAEIEWFQVQARHAKDDPAKKWWTVLDMARALKMAPSTAASHIKDELAKKHIRRRTGKKVGKGAAAQYQWNASMKNPLWAAQQQCAATDEQIGF